MSQDEENDDKRKVFFDNKELFPVLPDRFEAGPLEYQDKWIRLNLFETYNQLIN